MRSLVMLDEQGGKRSSKNIYSTTRRHWHHLDNTIYRLRFNRSFINTSPTKNSCLCNVKATSLKLIGRLSRYLSSLTETLVCEIGCDFELFILAGLGKFAHSISLRTSLPREWSTLQWFTFFFLKILLVPDTGCFVSLVWLPVCCDTWVTIGKNLIFDFRSFHLFWSQIMKLTVQIYQF